MGFQDFGSAQEGINFLLQPLFCPIHPPSAQLLRRSQGLGFGLGGIGLHLGTVERHMAQVHHPGLLAQAQDLNEQNLESIKVAPELAYAAVVWLQISGQPPEGQILVAGPIDFAGGDLAYAVGIDQQERQPLRGMLCLHARVLPLLAFGILGLGGNQRLIDPAYPPGRGGNSPGGPLNATSSAVEATGLYAPAAGVESSCTSPYPIFSLRSIAFTGICVV